MVKSIKDTIKTSMDVKIGYFVIGERSDGKCIITSPIVKITPLDDCYKLMCVETKSGNLYRVVKIKV